MYSRFLSCIFVRNKHKVINETKVKLLMSAAASQGKYKQAAYYKTRGGPTVEMIHV